MAKFKCVQVSFRNDRIIPVGEIVDSDVALGDNYEPIDDEAKALVAAAQAVAEVQAERIAAGLGAAASDGVVTAVKALEATVTAAVARIATIEANVASVPKDIEELDAGVQMALDRLDKVEATLKAAANGKKPAAPPPAPAPEPPATPPDAAPADPNVTPPA